MPEDVKETVRAALRASFRALAKRLDEHALELETEAARWRSVAGHAATDLDYARAGAIRDVAKMVEKVADGI